MAFSNQTATPNVPDGMFGLVCNLKAISLKQPGDNPTSSRTLTENTWHHIVVLMKVDTECKAFVNGGRRNFYTVIL